MLILHKENEKKSTIIAKMQMKISFVIDTGYARCYIEITN